MKAKLIFGAAFVVAAATLAVAFSSDDVFQGNVAKQPFSAAIHGKAAKAGSTQILYHGGPVMNQSNSVYVIYYGSFPATTEPIIDDFLFGLNGANPFQVNTTYDDSTHVPVPSTYTFVPPSGQPVANASSGSVYWDNYTQGTQLGNSSIAKIIAHAVTGAGALPANNNGVYIVITSPDVKVSGFCTSFCAYHNSSASIVNGMRIRYALVPDPTQRCSGCNGGIAKYGDVYTPNLDMGADTMTDDIMHELSETVTDPDINAWYTQGGAENGDLCNYVYDTQVLSVLTTVPVVVGGVTYQAHANFHTKRRDYLIQLIWKNSGAGFCAAQ